MTPMQSCGNRRALMFLLGFVPGVLLFAVATAQWWLVDGFHGDLFLYYQFSQRVLEGKLPYRDFPFEYPPLALLPVVTPRLAALCQPLELESYRWLFLLQGAACYAGIGSILAMVRERLRQPFEPAQALPEVLAIYVGLLTIGAGLLPWRYDYFPALLTAGALLAMVRNRPAWAGWWLGLGISAKLYPLVLTPVFGLYFLAGRNWKAVGRLAAGVSLGLGLSVGPFLLLDPTGVLSFLKYHQQRGIQVESLSSGGLLFGHAIGLSPVELVHNFGATHVNSPIGEALLPWHFPAFCLVSAVVSAAAYCGFRRDAVRDGAPSTNRLAVAACASVLAFICTNKVFSPQYVVWLLPFVPLLRLWHSAGFILMFAGTIAVFPFLYQELLDLRWQPILLLNLRNLLALALLGMLVRNLWRGGSPAKTERQGINDQGHPEQSVEAQ